MKKSQKLKKIALSAGTIVATAALSTASVFAWYALDNITKVGFNSSVGVIGNIQISLGDGEGQPDDESYGSYVNIESAQLLPITLSDESATNSAEDIQFTDMNGAPVGNGYITFTLWFKSPEETMLDFSAVDSSVVSHHTADRTKTVALQSLNGYGKDEYSEIQPNKEIDAKACNAVRILFQTDQNKIWEPNADDGFCNDVDGRCFASALGAQYTASYAEYETKHYETMDSVSRMKNLLQLEPNVAQSVTITLWIEGYDGDCIDSISNDIITTNLSFIGTKLD